MICPNCQTPNRPSARFCDGCGYELPAVMPRETVPVPARDAQVPDPFYDEDYFDIDEESAALTVDLGAVPTADLESEGLTVPLDDEDDDLPDMLTAPLDGSAAPSITSHIPVVDMSSHKGYRADGAGDGAPGHRFTKRKALIGALIALLVAAAIVGISLAAQFLAGRAVPDVIGMSQVDATYAVQEAGFRVKVEEVVSDEVEGIVLSCDPAVGSRIADGSTVTLRVSIPRVIPDVVGMKLDEAQALLGEDGFTNIEVVRKKSDEPEDTVLSVAPEPQTRSRADAKITLEAAEPFRVPDVVGKSQEEATALLEEEGYRVDAQRYNTEDAPEGQAVKTDPEAGTVLASGSAVKLFVAHNRSAELVNLTRKFFTDSPTITMDGQLYEMSKLGDVSYEGGSTCKFTITVRPIQTVTWFGTQTETRYGNYQTVNGKVTWSDNDQVSSIEPSIKQGG